MRKVDVLLICLLGSSLLLACNLPQGGEVRGLGEARSPEDTTPTPTKTMAASPTSTQTKAAPTPTATIRARLKSAPHTATPIMAATPAPTPIPEPASEPASAAGTVRVAADGSGDYPSLEEAVASVAEGTTIILEAGTYRLAGTLEVAQSLSLEGAGMDQTEIVSDAWGTVVRFSGGGSFSAEGITFRHEGVAAANVVNVAGGEIDFNLCRVTGAIRDEEQKIGGDGLTIMESATGNVRECRADGNERIGIRIQDQAQVTLEGNIVVDNGTAGIAVVDQAQPTLEGNTCAGNTHAGIWYQDNAGGVARGNECSGNSFGIVVEPPANPELVDNNLHDNLGGAIQDWR